MAAAVPAMAQGQTEPSGKSASVMVSQQSKRLLRTLSLQR
jgi:hypothetical protein